MRKLLLITTLLLSLVLPARAGNHSLESHLSRGYNYLDKRQFDDAIIEFLEVLSIEPDNIRAIEGIEKARSLSKEPARKIPPVESIGIVVEEKVEEIPKFESPEREKTRPNYSNLLTILILLTMLLFGFSLALTYQKRENIIQRKYDELLTYERASGFLPEDKNLVKRLANLYKEEEIFDSSSARAYEKAEMFIEAGLSYQNSKDLRKAAEIYERKSSLEGDDYGILQELAQIYHDLAEEDRMANVLRRMVAIREEPSDLNILGELSRKLKDTEGAIIAYEKLSRLDKKNPEYQDRLLELYFENGDREKFLTLAEEVQMRRELTLDNLGKLARIYVENSIFDKASKIYGKLIEKKPEYRYELIETLLIQNRIEEALEECQRLPLSNSQEVNNLLALYGRISEKDPENSRVRDLIEETYRKAEEKGLETILTSASNEREKTFRPPLIEAQEQYSLLSQKTSSNPRSEK